MSEKVQTVLGPIRPEDLGVTFCHEHLSMDFQEAAFTPPKEKDVSKIDCSFTLANVGWIRQVGLPSAGAGFVQSGVYWDVGLKARDKFCLS